MWNWPNHPKFVTQLHSAVWAIFNGLPCPYKVKLDRPIVYLAHGSVQLCLMLCFRKLHVWSAKYGLRCQRVRNWKD